MLVIYWYPLDQTERKSDVPKYHRKRFSPQTYAEIINRQKGRCACGCREKFTDASRIDFDHHIPLFLDGADHPDNLRAVKKNHHLKLTVAQTKARAKMKRLERQKGRGKMNQRDARIAKLVGLER